MGPHSATVAWERGNATFTDNRYSRRHEWQFDGGAVVTASSSPLVVPPPFSDPTGVDPEEAFIASLSSCHMLWFLAIAAKHGFIVDSYRDTAEGEMAKDAAGQMAITVVTLRPAVVFSGARLPSNEAVHKMHHEAHDACFIAHSVKTDVRCVPIFVN